MAPRLEQREVKVSHGPKTSRNHIQIVVNDVATEGEGGPRAPLQHQPFSADQRGGVPCPGVGHARQYARQNRIRQVMDSSSAAGSSSGHRGRL